MCPAQKREDLAVCTDGVDRFHGEVEAANAELRQLKDVVASLQDDSAHVAAQREVAELQVPDGSWPCGPGLVQAACCCCVVVYDCCRRHCRRRYCWLLLLVVIVVGCSTYLLLRLL